MNDFFNRTKEREKVLEILHNFNILNPYTLWIEGISGSGKTEFLKYIISSSDLCFFKLLEMDEIYKCEKVNIKNDFEYISNIVFSLQSKSSSAMEKYIHNFFSNLEHLSLLDACTIIMPQIKFLKPIGELLQSKYKGSIDSQNHIADKITNIQLVDFFSELIIHFFEQIYNYEQVILCIDDIQWLDRASTKVIVSILKKIRNRNSNLKVSIFCTAREKMGLSEDERENFLNVYNSLKDNVNNIYSIYIKNFNLKTTTDLIKSKGRYILEERVQKIFEITKGNPQELEQTLRFSDKEIDFIISTYDSGNSILTEDNHVFSRERIMGLYQENCYNAIIINILAIFTCRILTSLLFKLSSAICQKYNSELLLYAKFNEIIQDLITRKILEENTDGINLIHDSMKFLAKDLLLTTGEYSEYGDIIADILIDSDTIQFSKMNSNMYMAMEILTEVDPERGLVEFVEYYKKYPTLIDREMNVLGAKCFCSSLGPNSLMIAEYVIIPKVIPCLVNTSKLKIAQSVCCLIYNNWMNDLSEASKTKLLINYVKTQVDLSAINDDSLNENATNLYMELIEQKVQNKDLELQIYLLGMSVYEHTLDYNKIYDLSKKATELIDKGIITDYVSLALYYRNKGLYNSHSQLIEDYKLAVFYADNITSGSYKALLKGTSLNNLGLSYFYTGDIEQAISSFTESQKILENIGYDVTRIINNIAMCHVLKNEIDKAYDLLTIAISNRMDGIFMNACIDTNYALILSMLGEDKKANEILDVYIKEYDRKEFRTPDTLLYCAAMQNKGYINYMNHNYFDALKFYKQSCFHEYRFENELQTIKRENMSKLCLQAIDLFDKNEQIDMDINNAENNYYRKPYSAIVFAYYVV